MNRPSRQIAFPRCLSLALLCFLLALTGCASDDGDGTGGVEYFICSVVITPETRTTYVQGLASLDVDHVDNTNAIEVPGNGTMMARGPHLFVGLVEEPTWVRYTVGANGQLAETGRISFQSYGLSSVDYGNTIVDDHTAVSVASSALLAIVWDPETLTVTRTIDLPHLEVEGYDLEVWTTNSHDGLVYIPGRWANWDEGLIRDGVSLTILDPYTGEIVGVAEDDRCASGGGIVFDADGYGYVMGDGRTYSAQMFARARGDEEIPENCILRIPPGGTDFEEDFYVSVPELTSGLESITEMHTPRNGSGVAFAKMFYEDELPDGVEPTTWAFWSLPAMKMWRIELGDEPTAVEVQGMPFGAVGFTSSVMGGRIYSGESANGVSTVWEIDPETNTGTPRFTIEGELYGLHAVHD